MAEGIFKRIAEKNEMQNEFQIDSAGLIANHQGELPDSRMRHFAKKRNYQLVHRSRPFTRLDFERFDMIIGMDDRNIDGLKAHAMTKKEEKQIFRMTDFCRNIQADHVPDPYYGGDQGFEHVIDILEDACKGLFDEIMDSQPQ